MSDAERKDWWADDPCFVEVGVLSDQIREAEAQVDVMRAERRACYRLLLDQDVPRQAVAEQAGVTSMAVKLDLDAADKRAAKAADAAGE